MDNLEQNKDAADLVSEAAIEVIIADETREFLRSLPKQEQKKKSIRPIYIASIAASFLILVASIVTINLSHSDHSIAGKYGINALVARSGNNLDNSQFTAAVQAYYAKDYEKSRSILSQFEQEGGKITEYQDWLSLLIDLQTSGSTSETFLKQVDSIIANENHEFHFQALRLKKDLNLFWRKFVVK